MVATTDRTDGRQILDDAREAVEIVRGRPGLTAAGIARVHNQAVPFDQGGDEGGRFDPQWPRWNARQVRRLIYVARRDLHAPLIADDGGRGYRLADSAAEVRRHADRLERFCREYGHLAGLMRRAADEMETPAMPAAGDVQGACTGEAQATARVEEGGKTLPPWPETEKAANRN